MRDAQRSGGAGDPGGDPLARSARSDPATSRPPMLPDDHRRRSGEPSAADPIGRQNEIAAIVRWFADPASPTALLLEGGAGLGKTTVWAAALRAIRDGGQPVLMSAPAEAESRLSYAALIDLVADELPGIRAFLPGPQAVALAVAVRLEDPGDRPPDETAVARGWLEAQRCLARSAGRLLVAIDDVRWLDGPSLAAVAYGLRRLRGDDGVKVLLTHRTGAPSPPGLPLGELGEHLGLAPISLGGIHRIIRVQAGISLPRPRLLELYAASGGNPLHALELARASGAGGSLERGSIADLFVARLAALPRESRRALLLIAASSDRSILRLERAWGRDFERDIEPAVSAGLVALSGQDARPIHPLVTHVAYEEATDLARREAHRALAETAPTLEERAIHLARSAADPDPDVAALVEAAADEARARGVRPSSATLFESAARLTPPSATADRARRLLAAAASWFEAGDSDRAEAILRPLLAELAPGDQRCEAGWRLGVALDEGGRWQEATALWREALATARDPGLRSRLQSSLAITAFYTDSVQAARDWADAAVTAAEQSTEPQRLAEALAVQALTMSVRGDRTYADVIERALVIEETVPDLLGEWSPSAVAAEGARHAGHVDAARRHYARVLERALRIGDANIEQWAAFGLASSEILAGNYQRASELADSVLDLADQTGVMWIPSRSLRAHVDAHLGDHERARRLVGEAIERAAAAREAAHLFNGRVVLAVIETTAGDRAAAARAYAGARGIATELGLGHATALRAFLNEAEEAAAADRLDQATDALATFDRAVDDEPPPWSVPIRWRSEAAILAARGDLRAAREKLEHAIGDDGAPPLDRLRAQLALGAACRRLREYGRAREALGEALQGLVALGTPPWIERARVELGRIPGRRAGDDGALTGAEARIAELVAAGRTNKDVAAELFLSVKTVEVTLTRVYAKLGVRSRSELAAAFRRPSPKD